MSSVRLRRLHADYDKLREYAHKHPRIKLVDAQGTPPERYQLEFHLRSLRMKDELLQVVQNHLVEIHLPRDYPRTPPLCRMLTPIFHPNIAPHAVCIGDHWSAGEPLWSIVARIGEMIAYQSYNTKSPLNGEAARWVTEHLDELPLDSTSMLLDELPNDARRTRPARSAEAAPMARPVNVIDPVSAPPMARPVNVPASAPAPRAEPPSPIGAVLACPSCHARLRLPADKRMQRVRCPRCHGLVQVPA